MILFVVWNILLLMSVAVKLFTERLQTIKELRVPVPLLEVAEENEKILEELVEYVYQESDDYA